MSVLIVDNLCRRSLYTRADKENYEISFEAETVKCLSFLYPDHKCFVFSGSFLLDGVIQRPDLALVAKDFSHWFVIEVEVSSHSLEGHVIPQMRTIRFGEAQSDCATILARELYISNESAKTLLERVPRSHVVVADDYLPSWVTSLRALGVQFLSISKFCGEGKNFALVVDGEMHVLRKSLGYGTFYAVDKLIRCPNTMQIFDPIILVENNDELRGRWSIVKDAMHTWIIPEDQQPKIPDRSFVQVIRVMSGNYIMRAS